MITWKQGYYGWWNAYKEDGTKLIIPSVSKVVDSKDDPELNNWIEEIGQEKADKIMKLASDRGTAMHYFLENMYLAYSKFGDINKSLLYAQKYSPVKLIKEEISENSISIGRNLFYQLIESFNWNSDILDEREIDKVIGLESKIVDFELPYRGAYDINYLSNRYSHGQNVITDYKSSSSMVESGSVKERKYKLQLSGYWNAYEKMTGKELDVAKIWVSVKNAGTQEIKIDRSEYKDAFDEFKELCEHFHSENNQNLSMFSVYKISK